MHVYHNFILHIKIFFENILYHLIVIQHLLTLEMTPETGFFLNDATVRSGTVLLHNTLHILIVIFWEMVVYM
jgi:hypothetical protein